MSTTDHPLSARLHRELLADRVGTDEPGAVIAAYRDGELIASACAGVADTKTGEPLSPTSLMNIASVSKQIVATTVLLAARRGQIDLDADIRELVPEIKLPGITLRHCLHHTAGLPDYFAAATIMDIEELEIAGLDTFLAWLSTVTEPDFAPGYGQSYSNTGFVSAALATERACGKTFPELIADTVFRPLGMNRTFVTTVLGEFVPGMAISFTPQQESFTRHDMGIGQVESVRGVNGDGEVITCITDFARWQGFLLDGRVLGTDIRSQLLERVVLSDGRRSTYGLGIEHETRGDTTAYAHSGGMWGYAAYSLCDPLTGVGIAVFTNRDDIDAVETAWRGFRLVTGPGGICGRWFAERKFSAMRLAVCANGDLDADLGGESLHLVKAGPAQWTRDDDFSLVEVVDGQLFVAAWFGLRERYERIAAAGPFPAHAVGKFTEPFRGKAYRLEDRDGRLWIVRPNGEAELVAPFGSRNGEWIGKTSVGWLVIDTAATARVRIGSGSVIVELTRAADGD